MKKKIPSQSYIKRIENGDLKTPSIFTIKKIAKRLNMSLWELLSLKS